MPTSSFRLLALTAAFYCVMPAGAATLPGNLVKSEIEDIVQTVGFGATQRLMRSSEIYQGWPGLKLGVELGFAGPSDIGSFGNAQSSIPGVLMTPRLLITKSFFDEVELSLGIMPFDSPFGITANGVMLKWGFSKESDGWLAGAAYFGYTHVRAFNSAYEGNNVEFGVSFSKDYVRLKPYLGAGLLFAEGGVTPQYAATDVLSVLQATMHTFAGLEWELPLTFTFQFDLMNLTPMGSLLIGKKF